MSDPGHLNLLRNTTSVWKSEAFEKYFSGTASGTAATFTENITNTNRLPAVCEPGDDRPPADIPTDEAAASISPYCSVLQSETTSYKITGFIGGGGCANVAKCVDLNTGKEVAIKIHNKKYDEEIIQNELAMLGKIRALDPDRHNIVKFIEKCQYGELPCLVFEMLDISLSDLIEERERRALSVNELRPVTQQLLVALEALKNFGIIHMDLNPDNIILVNHNDQPFQIKLIDFGLARPGSQVEDDDLNWTLWYRPPEGVLGVPLSEAVDMWGVGCVMAFMYFGRHLFPNMYPEDWMDTQVHLLGVPDQNQIIAGKNSWRYFFLDEKAEWRRRKVRFNEKRFGVTLVHLLGYPDRKEIGSSRDGQKYFIRMEKGVWKLHDETYNNECGWDSYVSEKFFNSFLNLEDAVKTFPVKKDDLEYADRMAFLDLLKCCLHLSAQQRICPMAALYHRFITKAHLADEKETNSY
uniref:Protein kinase domain-containing protein n=1 Tax=Scophthalmus maximus TaxID=52904 RepID=A0A8D3AZG1_SCOMX